MATGGWWLNRAYINRKGCEYLTADIRREPVGIFLASHSTGVPKRITDTSRPPYLGLNLFWGNMLKHLTSDLAACF